MFCKIRVVCTLALAVVSGCSDDGVPGQGQNSSTSGHADDGSGSPADAPNSTSDGGSTGSAGSSGGEPPSATTGGGTQGETEGDVEVDTEGDTEGTTSGDTEGTTTGEICEPITEDPTGIGTPCQTDMDCLPGYTCQVFEGFVLELSCQILCEDTCECPEGLTCTLTQDKVKSWFQCDP